VESVTDPYGSNLDFLDRNTCTSSRSVSVPKATGAVLTVRVAPPLVIRPEREANHSPPTSKRLITNDGSLAILFDST
jgi:hypothetical protein